MPKMHFKFIEQNCGVSLTNSRARNFIQVGRRRVKQSTFKNQVSYKFDQLISLSYANSRFSIKLIINKVQNQSCVTKIAKRVENPIFGARAYPS